MLQIINRYVSYYFRVIISSEFKTGYCRQMLAMGASANNKLYTKQRMPGNVARSCTAGVYINMCDIVREKLQIYKEY